MSRSKPTVKCGFKTSKDNANVHSIAFNDLTSGEVLALIHALQIARTISPVAQDVSAYLRNALHAAIGNQAAIDKAQEFFEEITGEIDVVVGKQPHDSEAWALIDDIVKVNSEATKAGSCCDPRALERSIQRAAASLTARNR